MSNLEHRIIGLLVMGVIFGFIFLSAGCVVVRFDEPLTPMEPMWYETVCEGENENRN